jgi:CRISPR-associated endonuclease/helicase Cas3
MLAKRFKYNNTVYFQSFNGHVEDGLKILVAYLKKKESIVHSFCDRWEIDFQLFCKNIFLVVAMHDIGKLTREFQENIRGGKCSSRYPHPLFAVPILKNISFDEFVNLPLSLYAILGHHTQLYRTIYESTKLAEHVNYLQQEIHHFINWKTKELYEQMDFHNFFAFPSITFSSFHAMGRTKIFDSFIRPGVKQSIKENEKVKSVYTYMFSLLQLCDDYSSAYFNQYIEKNLPDNKLFDSVISDTKDFVFDLEYSDDEFKSKLFNNQMLYAFQKELAEKSEKFSFLFAPCGRGKTEASIWWAWNIKKSLKKDRIILALPTQVTCNAMYSRLIDDYGFKEKEVGLFHGKSLITLKYRKENQTIFEFDEEAEESEEKEIKQYDLFKDEVFKGNVFFKPLTVTTIDHLAYAFVHGFSQADFACGNTQNAAIIFDEIHYYEKHTLDVLTRLFHILRKMDIPHLLMTGTAPDFILDEFKKDYKLLIDNEGLKFQPFIITKQDNIPILDNDSIYESILRDLFQRKNIFIILNQVEWSQQFYRDLKEYMNDSGYDPSIVLYHSRFIHKDRVKKENEIKELVKNKPCILVATQVIEISLDISSDVMYSTIAPPDAIGQRAGRLNRKGQFYKNANEFELKLFQVENNLPYEKQIIDNSWFSFKRGPYSYKRIKEVCDEVYKNVRLIKDRAYKNYFQNNVLFGDHYRDITFGEDEGRALQIRENNFQQIDVVPSRVFEEAETLVRQKNAVWEEFKVKIPLFQLKKDIWDHGEAYNFQKHPEYKILECEFEYDYNLGIQFNRMYKRTSFL